LLARVHGTQWQVPDINELCSNVISRICFVDDDTGNVFAQATLPRRTKDDRD